MRSLFEDQKLVLEDCTTRFEKLDISYMLSGSMAMAAYAMMRMTNDIDIVLELQSSDAERFIAEFQPDYYVSRDRVRDSIYRKRMFNILHQATIVKVDCVIAKGDAFQKTAFARRTKLSFAGIDVWTISKEDLILSKLLWAKDTKSEIQMRDVANIIRNGFDEDYVQSWVENLDLVEIMLDTRAYLERNLC